jgi:hypothetical protein
MTATITKRVVNHGRPGEVLLGILTSCSCREGAVHLLTHLRWDEERREPRRRGPVTVECESLRPVCGSGQVGWVWDNFVGDPSEVTCQRCLRITTERTTS